MSSYAGCLLQKTNKRKIQTQSSADKITTHSAVPIRGKKKKQNNSAQISHYRKPVQTTEPTLGEWKPKGRKNSTLNPGKRRL